MSVSDVSNIHISNDVIATIVNVAATEVDGVHSLTSSLSENIKDIIYKKGTSKGVNVEINENNDITVTVNMVIKYNYKIQEVALNVQNQVVHALSDMTNYNVAAVNINVVGVNIPKEESNK